MRRLRAWAERWPLARPFAIARGVKTEAVVVVAEIAEDGAVGRGEAVPYARYGESVEGALAAIAAAAALPERLTLEELPALLPAGAARCAIDCALWDLACKRSGRRAWELAGIDPPRPTVCAETIGVDSPAAMAGRARALRDRPLLKVKLAAEGALERLEAVRAAAPAARLIVDANEGWDLALLEALSPDLARLGVAVVEQPLPAGVDEALRGFRSPVALCADESCHVAADLERLPDGYRMVNVKLDKAGGLTAALALSEAARARGLAVMVGCMVATSLAIAPATLLMGSADLVDLDGPLWLAADRAPSMLAPDGRIGPPDPALWG